MKMHERLSSLLPAFFAITNENPVPVGSQGQEGTTRTSPTGDDGGSPPPPPGTGGSTGTSSPTQQGVFALEQLEALTKWASTGFVLLSGIVTFFGLKTGALDRITAEDPASVLGVFCLVGLGVVASLLAGATNAKVAVLTGWVIALLALEIIYVKALLSARYLPHVERGAWIAVVVAALVLAAISIVAEWRMALPAALLVAALTSIVLGLFVAVSVSVASKTDESFRVVASIVPSDDGDTVKVAVSGTRRLHREGRLVVEAVGRNAAGGETTTSLGSGYFTANDSNQVKQTFTFPVDRRGTRSVVVLACVGARDCHPEQMAKVRFGSASAEPAVEGTLARGASDVKAHLAALHLRDGQVVRFTVASGGRVVAKGELQPDATGAAKFDHPVPETKKTIALSAAVCGPSCEPARELARLAPMK